MPRRNRRDTDNVRVRTRKARSEYAPAGVLSYHADGNDAREVDEREPETAGQR